MVTAHLPSSEEDLNLNFKSQMLDSNWLAEKCFNLIGSPGVFVLSVSLMTTHLPSSEEDLNC